MAMSSPRPPRRMLALAVIALGLLLVLGSLFADSLGITGGGEGYGWKQLIATIVGLSIAVAGAAWYLRPALPEPDLPLEPE